MDNNIYKYNAFFSREIINIYHSWININKSLYLKYYNLVGIILMSLLIPFDFILYRDNNIYTELKKDYVNPKNFINELKKHNIKFFTGIPDSLLKNFTNNIDNNFITANEGSAIALASGYARLNES